MFVMKRLCFVAGIEAVAPEGEKYTKPNRKERPAEAPLLFTGFVIFHHRDYKRKARAPPKLFFTKLP